jgi:hypothetical protein
MESVHAPTDHPRISANLLGELAFASEARRRAILRGHKFPRARATKAIVSHYSPAQFAILRSLDGGKFDRARLEAERLSMKPKKPDDRRSISRCQDNRAAIHSFLEIGELALPTGEHFKTRQNSSLLIDGVVVSARPEIISEDRKNGRVAFTKFRFSKSKASVDESEIILLALLKFGEARNWSGMRFDLPATKLIDCFAKTVICGHQLPQVREKQLTAALAEVRRLWPSITPTN